ncbi:uncharacterized protein CELE_F02E11.2 [Caenorhabditis elegans]|uniref:Secreted protein n=1 Tax=Caenorhabditis elegans TaxID=6239 RepID=G4S102_CAEEL|nr:Secreted protein [Caenorhabditis elegans]CCD64923.1 Secreted protein [Caenorhabditis elegans]|eukprot:NP_001254065.1 Uncharacterized protein CELE_F02E11.2 [Caenorhabditis elegans]
MQSIQFLAIFFITILLTVSAAPQQTYRTYRSLLRDGTFDHASMFRFTSDGAAASGQKLPRFGQGFRDYPLQYGASSPLYVFDGRLYNLASARS